MQKNNKNFLRISDHNENLSNRVFMQEVINWEYIDHGIKKTTLKRKFRDDDYNDHYISEIISYEKKEQ
jgi:hypothetical protein